MMNDVLLSCCGLVFSSHRLFCKQLPRFLQVWCMLNVIPVRCMCCGVTFLVLGYVRYVLLLIWLLILCTMCAVVVVGDFTI